MAGDWIKMRLNLISHPKVLMLAENLVENGQFLEWMNCAYGAPSLGGTDETVAQERYEALRVTRYVCVAALLRFWGYANEHANEDETVKGLSAYLVDEVVGVPGFATAMQEIGWIIFDESAGVAILPNFNKHNVVGGKRTGAAERQKRYREKQKTGTKTVTGDVTQTVTHNGDVTRDAQSREEKKRVDKNKNKDSPTGSRFSLTDLPDDWKTYCETERADLAPDRVFEDFRDYWIAVAGAKGRKLDWFATWRTWVRRQDAGTKKPAAAPWWTSDASIQAKGRELGMTPNPGESWQNFRGRINERLGAN